MFAESLEVLAEAGWFRSPKKIEGMRKGLHSRGRQLIVAHGRFMSCQTGRILLLNTYILKPPTINSSYKSRIILEVGHVWEMGAGSRSISTA